MSLCKFLLIHKIPTIVCISRGFHFTHSTYIRKIATVENLHGRKSNLNKCESVEIFTTSNTDCENFFGVETDHGVIFIDSNQKVTSYPQFPVNRQKKESKEKFLSAPFGVIRRDVDNSVASHGQYHFTEDTFPYKSNEYADVRKAFDEFTIESKDTVTDVSNRKSTRPCEDSESNATEVNSSTSAISNANVTDLSRASQYTSDPKHSFIDDCYFESMDCDINKEIKTKFVRDDSYKIESSCGVKGSFNASSTITERKAIFENEVDVSSEINNVKTSYFDNQFFGSLDTKSKDCEKDESNLFEQTYFEKNNLSIPSEYSTNILNSECASGKDSFWTKSKVPGNDDNFLEKSVSFKILQQTSELDNSQNVKYIDLSRLNNTKSHQWNKDNAYNIKDELTLDRNKNEINVDLKPNLMYRKSSNCKLNQISDSVQQQSAIGFNGVTTNESKNFASTVKIGSSDDKKCVSTALDFVYKLRKEDKGFQPTKIGQPIVKKDSKGFRILKDQVPDFTKYTAAEIVNHLKQNILYADDDLVVLNKPYNLVMHDSETNREPGLSRYLDELASCIEPPIYNSKLLTVHRLDKETTGCTLLARTETMAQHLKALFAQRKIVKKYWIVTCRIPNPLEGIIDMPITEGTIGNKRRMVLQPDLPKDTPYRNHSKGGKRAISRYKVISVSGNAALIEVEPETGIKHQIRVHFGFGLNCPILGDHKYSHLDKLAPQKLSGDILQRLSIQQSKVRFIPMHIHARSITIPEHLDGRDLFIMAPLPKHMGANLQKLKFKKK